MKAPIEINKVSELHRMSGLNQPSHPLVSVIYNRELKNIADLEGVKLVNNLYTVIFKSSNQCSTISYGRNLYDYEEGTIVFTAPGQVIEFENDGAESTEIDPDGWSLVFHPDVFRKSTMSERMKMCSSLIMPGHLSTGKQISF